VKFDIVEGFTLEHNKYFKISFPTINRSFFTKYIFQKLLMEFFLFQQSMASLFTKVFDEILFFSDNQSTLFLWKTFVEAFDGTKVKFDMVQEFYFETP